MKKIRKFVFVLFLLPFIAVSGQDYVTGFELRNLENQTVTFEDLKGESLTVVDFWATWCKPCIYSIPKLEEIYLEFADEGVNFIGVSVDSPRNLSKVRPMAASLGITYPVVLDPNSETMSNWNILAVPTLLVINEDNEVLYFHEGFKPGDEELIRGELNQLLNKTPKQ